MRAQQYTQKEFRTAVAYHEAGHAVAACCLGIRVLSATIVPGDGLGGQVEIEREKPSTWAAVSRGERWHLSRFRAEKLVMFLQAGEVAQLRYDPGSVSPRHCLLDLNQCIAILANYAIHDVDPDTKLHYGLLYKWTECLIERQWPKVEAVVKTLLERRKLSGSQIRDVILAASQKERHT